jgi:cardiolipin synthase
MKGRIWTVPNQITLLRLGFLPFFLILISYEHYRWALLLLVVAGLSDGIDGLLARKLNQKSALGAYLDPIADKLLLSSSFVILAFKSKIAWWLTIMVLSRDILLLTVAAVILLISGYRPFPPSILGKCTTAAQILLVFLVVLGAAYPGDTFTLLIRILVYTVAVLTTVSGFHYSITIASRLHSPS